MRWDGLFRWFDLTHDARAPVVEQGRVEQRQAAEAGESRGVEQEDELALVVFTTMALMVAVGAGGGGWGHESRQGLGLVDGAVEGGA